MLGAGKSTLVKLLIEVNSIDIYYSFTLHEDLADAHHIFQLRNRKGEKCETPVVGRVDDGLSPTSGDVHLYPDPNSFDTNRPLLYADCEGIQGGDRLPKAAKARNRLVKAAHKAQKHAVFETFAMQQIELLNGQKETMRRKEESLR